MSAQRLFLIVLAAALFVVPFGLLLQQLWPQAKPQVIQVQLPPHILTHGPQTATPAAPTQPPPATVQEFPKTDAEKAEEAIDSQVPRVPTRAVDRLAPSAHLQLPPNVEMRPVTAQQLHAILDMGDVAFRREFKDSPPPREEQIVALEAEGAVKRDGGGYQIAQPIYDFFTRVDITRHQAHTKEEQEALTLLDSQLATAVFPLAKLDRWPGTMQPCDSKGDCFKIAGAHLKVPDPVLKHRALTAGKQFVHLWGSRVGTSPDGLPIFEISKIERGDAEIKTTVN